MRPLAIVQHDAALREEILLAMEGAGFKADCFRDGSTALAFLRKRSFALTILDLDINDTDPFAVCREAARFTPVIAFTTQCATEICVRAFEAGADDCVSQPIAGRELVARVRNVLRRAEESPDDEPFALAVAEMRIRDGNVTHDLTKGEAELLALLVARRPAPVTVAEMTVALGAKRGTLESRVKSLRRKLGAERLISRGRFGYQLLGG